MVPGGAVLHPGNGGYVECRSPHDRPSPTPERIDTVYIGIGTLILLIIILILIF